MGCISSKQLDAIESATGIDLDGDGKAGGKVATKSAAKYVAAAGSALGVGTPNPRAKEDADTASRELDDGSSIPLSTCNGNKKALFIGINYFGTSSELKGCINDVKNIKAFVTQKFGFPTDAAHMRTLTDDQKDPHFLPTCKNMIEGMKWLVAGAQAGDSLFFHYSGHGGTQKDVSPDSDEIDGQDETLCPMDYATAGQLVDDDIHKLLVAGLPQGVRLTAIVDACHSGSVFDLPYTYNVDKQDSVSEVDNRKVAMEAAMRAGKAFMAGNKALAMKEGMAAVQAYMKKDAAPVADASGNPPERIIQIRATVADVIQFSGCRDSQTSADVQMASGATGAMSWAFKLVCEENQDLSFNQLMAALRKKLAGKFEQVPQMSSGHRMNMDSKFIM